MNKDSQILLTRGVPMGQALPPRDCESMREFLRALVHYSKQGKVNIQEFLLAWRELKNGHKYAVKSNRTNETRNEDERRRYHYRKQNGLCVRCGQPRGAEKSYCLECKQRRVKA
jgi:hypothetical protein